MTATPIPPGIEMPAEVETRLGTLRFFDGFPDEETTRTLFDNLDLQRAVQAYVLAVGPVYVASTRRGLARWGPANGTVALWEDLVHPSTVAVGMNSSTPYGVAWLDLHDGPVVVDVPPRVLGFVNDAWEGWVADVGLTGPDQGQGGSYVVVPPGHDAEVADGHHVVRAPTYGTVLVLRGYRVGRGDGRPAVEEMKARTRIHPLDQTDAPPPTRFVDVSHEPWVITPPADDRFWELLDEVVQGEPPESADPVTLGMFAAIGIRRGRPFRPDERMRAILTEAAVIGAATVRAITYRFREEAAYLYPGSAWRTVLLGGYRFQDHGVALLDSAAQFCFTGPGVSPAEEQEMVGAGSQYAVAFLDAAGAPFDGGRAYRLHLPPGAPVNDFWSVLVYDTQTRSMLQTDQEWPSVTSQDPELATNRDGSVDVHFGPEPPRGGGNWIQTVPGKGWWAMVRLYGPLEPWFDRTWRLPEIEPLG